MKKSQQGAAVAVIAMGLIILAVGAVILISRLLEERSARQRLEEEAGQLRLEIDKLRARRSRFGTRVTASGAIIEFRADALVDERAPVR